MARCASDTAHGRHTAYLTNARHQGGWGGEGAHALGDVDREQAVNRSWPTLQPATQIETESRGKTVS